MKSTASKALAICGASLAFAMTASAATITFEELTFPGGADYASGYDGTANAGFVSGGVTFNHGAFNGFAYSKATDNTTPGYGNQYSAFAGSGAGGSSNYVIGYTGGPTETTFAALTNLTGLGMSVTNTTYAALSMQSGDDFAKKFGGASGDDPDFFKLILTGSAGGFTTGTIEYYLADFRFADNSQDYLVSDWEFLDLTALGTVDKITFTMDSSDTGMFGVNTPTYFALDNFLAVPEPSALLLSVTGLAIFARRKRSI
jgi:hypothetical protein